MASYSFHIASPQAREDELRTLGRIESLSEETTDDLSVVSVSRCMSNDDDEEEEDVEEKEIERLEKERSFGAKISSPTRSASGGIPTQL